MRHLAIAVLMLVLPPAILSARPDAPASQPDARARIAALLADLFNQPCNQQQQARQQLESEPNLPALLGALLADENPAVRRTSLMLLRDSYGDWAVVSAVQALLRGELARGPKADGYVIAACCEILSDWPQWDSIPVLLNAMRSNQQVATCQPPVRSGPPTKTSVWRGADAALRLVSGEWPMPEPDASAQPVAPGSTQDHRDCQQLQKAWGDWWANSATLAEPLPQARIELAWTLPSGRPTATGSTTITAANSLLWVRPTGSIHYSRLIGTAPSSADPAWKWDDRTRRQCELHLNAIQADAVRAVAADVAAATPATTWAIGRPAGLPDGWHGRVQVTMPYGQTATVDLAETGTPGAVRPPAGSAEALSELLSIPSIP